MGRMSKSIAGLASVINKSLRVGHTWIIKKDEKIKCSSCGDIELEKDIISKNPKCPKCGKQTILLTYPEINQTEYADYFDSVKNDMDKDEIEDTKSPTDASTDRVQGEEKEKLKLKMKDKSIDDTILKLKKDITGEEKEKKEEEKLLELKLKKTLKEHPELKKKIEKKIPEEKRAGWVAKLAHSIATKDIGVLNAFFPEDMQISEDERKMLQEDWEFLIDFYSDKLEELLKWLPVLMIIVSHALIIGSRLKRYFSDKKKKEEMEKEKKKEKSESPKSEKEIGGEKRHG